MKDKERIENSRLITEFMEIKEKESFYNSYERNIKIYSTSIPGHSSLTYSVPNKSFYDFISTVNYYCDWNLLMQVVEKIKKLIYIDNYKVKGSIGENIKCVELYTSIFKTFHRLNIKLTYKAVIEFIKWYNEANNKE